MNGDYLEHYFTNNEDLKSELKTIKYNYQGNEFTFLSDNGVFSKTKIDFGSKTLVETYLEKKDKQKEIKSILDVGCGYGFIGIVLSVCLKVKATLLDINKRAVHLAVQNGKKNNANIEVVLSDLYEGVNNRYDLIITNPPIRAGKKVVYDILKNAQNYLATDGELWFVMRKDQGAKSAIKDLANDYQLDVLKKENGFYIIRGKSWKNVDIKKDNC